jgi:signal transduction histidine kinase
MAGFAFGIARNPGDYLRLRLLFWVLILAAVELFPVPSRQGLQLSLGFPIQLALAILYPPPVAATIAFVGTLDVREWTGERPILLAILDRAQIALSVLAGSVVFHELATIYPPASPWYVFIPAVMVATVADYTVNVTIVALYLWWTTESSIRQILAGMRLGSLSEFLLSYLGLSLIGAVIARLYLAVELWAVVALLLPLLFARRMFFRTMALEEATEELKDRERLLRALSNRMAEERADERMQIAGYLHDELAQILFRLTLQLDTAKKRLAAKDFDVLARHLEDIADTKKMASDMVRALIKDLHRSPVGRAGLADAVRSFAAEAQRDSHTRFSVDLADVTLPPAIQLLVYQIAREAMLNAIKHANATNVSVSLAETDEGVELRIHDDGRGFDPETRSEEGHFGLPMMRERARLAGGRLLLESSTGHATTIVATFPKEWVQEDTGADTPERANQPSQAQPDRSADRPPSATTTTTGATPGPRSSPGPVPADRRR